jgi:hypothetical protein
MRKRTVRKIRLKRAPVTQGLADHIRMGLHSALVVLSTKFASDETIEQLAEGIDMVGYTIDGDPGFKDEVILLNSGILALQALARRGLPVVPTEFERVPITNAVNAVDAMLPRLDATKLFLALQRVRVKAEPQ